MFCEHSLVEKLLVLLRDGRKLMGTLCSFDQFANAVLESACERVIVGDLYCDIPLGLYVIRGENVVLIGPGEGGASSTYDSCFSCRNSKCTESREGGNRSQRYNKEKNGVPGFGLASCTQSSANIRRSGVQENPFIVGVNSLKSLNNFLEECFMICHLVCSTDFVG
ncbi:uncharacterized protein LOC123218249 isoform X2 [Mangifera indica]|uniref:uncharacterized protein LOC123218249 isoform X2 n=1 Tax=Mangifera indica TaxID=29780 RepID=UPI001CFACCA4|nr:uncharacterized protein LOC123218249 isoform X2 [Mangifera indica]